MKGKEPAVSYISHGAPTMVLDGSRGQLYRSWAERIWPDPPELILMLSAHWQTDKLALGTADGGQLIYDFYGFPDQLYSMTYDAPGAPEARNSLEAVLSKAGMEVSTADRGWDHGVWTPLHWLFPSASVPVLQISLPHLEGSGLIEMGALLGRWVRERGAVWFIGSGGLTHNLGAIDFSGTMPVPAQMQEFETTVLGYVEKGDLASLKDYRRKVPFAELNHPTEEHFLPLIPAMAAAMEIGYTGVEYPLSGFEFGTLSKRSIDFRPA